MAGPAVENMRQFDWRKDNPFRKIQGSGSKRLKSVNFTADIKNKIGG